MAANNYLMVDPARQQGYLAMRIRDLLVELLDKTDELGEALGQAAADDAANSTTTLQTILGAVSTDDAAAIQALVGSVRTNAHDANNAFSQYVSRINRNF